MRTIEELLKQNIDRENMSEEELKLYIDYWFDRYETEGFSKVFCSPYDGVHSKNGKTFTVLKRVKPLNEDNEGGADMETLPLWNIQFEEGEILAAYPEEVIPSEIKDNMWRESDKRYLLML